MKDLIQHLLREGLLNEGNPKFIFKDNPGSGFNGWEKKNIKIFINGDDKAWADFKVKDGKVYIEYIEAHEEGHGYGQMIMKHLASIYGYENIVRDNLTPSGGVMRQKLDKHFNYTYVEESVTKYPLQYLGQCDLLRHKSEENEEKWHKMMADKQQISFDDFVKSVDYNAILDEDEDIKTYLEDAVRADDSTAAYKSMWGDKETIFLQTAGFEFIFV